MSYYLKGNDDLEIMHHEPPYHQHGRGLNPKSGIRVDGQIAEMGYWTAAQANCRRGGIVGFAHQLAHFCVASGRQDL
jgi:hypothetical protein